MEIGPHQLDRFYVAQQHTHRNALAEIKYGTKLTHWMWWEFPQLRGLGQSHRARLYGIRDLDEATRFLADKDLGKHLLENMDAMLLHGDKTAQDILGEVDAMKLRSCATLFAAVPDAPDVFARVLEAFFDGHPCEKTKERLET